MRSWWWTVALTQAGYFLVTGLWPVVHLPSFLLVTGDKADTWLVQFLGVLVCVPGASLGYAAVARQHRTQTLIAGAGVAFALAGGDVDFVARGLIRRVHLVAAVEATFLRCWLFASTGRARLREPGTTPAAGTLA